MYKDGSDWIPISCVIHRLYTYIYLKLLSNSSQNDDRTSRWHCKRIVTLVLAAARAVSCDGCSIAVGLDKKSLQIF